MSIRPLPPGRLRDMVTGTKSTQADFDAWNQQPQEQLQQVAPAPVPQQQGVQQQGALQQAIKGPSFEDSMNNTMLRGGSASQIKSGKNAVGNVASGAMTGASLGSVVPGIGTAIGAGLGAAYGGIKSLFGTRQNQLTDMARPDFDKNVAAAYRTYLGREASPQEIASLHPNSGKYVNQNMYTDTFKSIQNSPEAQAYAAKMAAPQAAPQQAPDQAAVAQAISGGTAGKGILEGFDANKMANAAHAEKSPKYAFAAIASKYDQSDPAQREQMLAELRQNKFFKNASFTGNKGDILDVGDNADEAFKGIRQFDVVRGMGEGGKAWQWGAIGGDSGGNAGGGGAGLGADYNASGDPVLAAINGQSLNPVTRGMDMLKQLLAGIPGGINGIAGGQ